MEQIKAFVGHSFTDDDASVVNKFIEYLRQISKIHPNFSWEHATEPEPTGVTEKVIKLFENKNLFIAICTKKEFVIEPSLLDVAFLRSDKRIAKFDHFKWKVSDWIIQEIGLSIGRNMKIILLLEDGVRPPGALQRDLEYIVFERAAPEKSFTKLLGMISKLISPEPGAKTVLQEDTDSGGGTAETQKKTEESVEINKTSTSSKHFDDFAYELMMSIFHKDKDAINEVNDKYLATLNEHDENAKLYWKAYKENLHITFGQGGDITILKDISQKLEDNFEVTKWLAHAYSRYEDNAAAVVLFEKNIQLSTDNKQKIISIQDAAESYFKLGQVEKAKQLISLLNKYSDDNEFEVLEAKLSYSQQSKNDEQEIAFLERILEIEPTNDDYRFKLAYKYSALKRTKFSLYHYLKIARQSRSSMSWNNLGVAYAELSMPIRAVDSYKESEVLGETLAMNNLAWKYLEAGFMEEAKNIVRKGLDVKDHHQNLDKTMGEINDRVENENQKTEDILVEVQLSVDFYKGYGKALLKDLDKLPTSGILNTKKYQVRYEIVNGVFKASGEYETNYSGLSNALVGNSTLAIEPALRKKTKIEFLGSINGYSIEGKIHRNTESDSTGSSGLMSLTLGELHPKFLMYFDGDKTFKVLERNDNEQDKFYDLEAIL